LTKEGTCVRAEYWDAACGVRTYLGHELQFHGGIDKKHCNVRVRQSWFIQ